MALSRAALKYLIWRRSVGTSNGNLENLVTQLLQVTSARSRANELQKIQALSQLAYCLRDNSECYEGALPALPALLKLYNKKKQISQLWLDGHYCCLVTLNHYLVMVSGFSLLMEVG